MPTPVRLARRSALVALGAALTLRPLRSGAQAVPKVRAAAIPLDVGALAYYAADMGFYTKHGVEVEVTTGQSGAAVAAAVIGGSLDIGNGNTTVLAQAHEHGLPFVLISPSGMYSSKDPTGGLLVAKTSTLKTASDLIGKTVAVATLKAISEVGIRSWLDKNGVSSDAVKYVEMPYSAMDPAFVAGRVDAGVTEEPATSNALAANSRVFAYVMDAIAPQFIEGAYFCTLDYAKANPEVIKRFADAMAETAAWANAHRDLSLKILNKYSKVAFPGSMHRMAYPERLHARDLQPLIDASARYGLLKATFPAKEMFAPGIEG